MRFVLILCLCLPVVAGDRIAYLSSRNGNFDIYALDLESGSETRLTENEGWDWFPKWCEGRDRIMYLGKRDDVTQVWEMNASGESKQKTPAPPEQTLMLSPDGKRWVYTKEVSEGNWEVFTAAFYGSDEKKITHSPAYEGRPMWSPDGKHILFISERDGNNELYLMKPDGGDVRRLTNNPAREKYAAWSPDGKSIAFTSDRDHKKGEIYMIGIDGKGLTRITDNDFSEEELAWGHQRGFLVHSDKEGGDEIFLVSTDGKNWRRLTNNSFYEGEPVWLPAK